MSEMTEGPLTASPPPLPRQFGGAAAETNQRRGSVLAAINIHTGSVESDKCSLDQTEASRFFLTRTSWMDRGMDGRTDRRMVIDGPESPPTPCVKSLRLCFTWEESLNLHPSRSKGL